MTYHMREKYIDEKVGVFHVFGYNADNPNLVDVSDGQRDVFTDVPLDVANRICELQAQFRTELYRLMAVKGLP